MGPYTQPTLLHTSRYTYIVVFLLCYISGLYSQPTCYIPVSTPTQSFSYYGGPVYSTYLLHTSLYTYIVVFLLWARILNLPATYQSLHLHSSFPTMGPYTQPTCYIPVSTLTQQFSYYVPVYSTYLLHTSLPLTQQFSYYQGPVYSTYLLHASLYTYIVVFLLCARILNLPATYQSLHLHSSFPTMDPYTQPTCYIPVPTLTQQFSYYAPVYSTDLLHTSLYTYIVVFLLWARILNQPATYQSLHLHSCFPSMDPYTQPTATYQSLHLHSSFPSMARILILPATYQSLHLHSSFPTKGPYTQPPCYIPVVTLTQQFSYYGPVFPTYLLHTSFYTYIVVFLLWGARILYLPATYQSLHLHSSFPTMGPYTQPTCQIPVSTLTQQFSYYGPVCSTDLLHTSLYTYIVVSLLWASILNLPATYQSLHLHSSFPTMCPYTQPTCYIPVSTLTLQFSYYEPVYSTNLLHTSLYTYIVVFLLWARILNLTATYQSLHLHSCFPTMDPYTQPTLLHTSLTLTQQFSYYGPVFPTYLLHTSFYTYIVVFLLWARILNLPATYQSLHLHSSFPTMGPYTQPTCHIPVSTLTQQFSYYGPVCSTDLLHTSLYTYIVVFLLLGARILNLHATYQSLHLHSSFPTMGQYTQPTCYIPVSTLTQQFSYYGPVYSTYLLHTSLYTYIVVFLLWARILNLPATYQSLHLHSCFPTMDPYTQPTRYIPVSALTQQFSYYGPVYSTYLLHTSLYTYIVVFLLWARILNLPATYQSLHLHSSFPTMGPYTQPTCYISVSTLSQWFSFYGPIYSTYLTYSLYTYILDFLLWARILNLPATQQSLHLHSRFPTMGGPYTQPTCYIPVSTLTQQFSYYGPVYSTYLLHTSLYTYIVVFLLWARILNLPDTYQSLHLHSSFPTMGPYTQPTCYIPVSTLTQQFSYYGPVYSTYQLHTSLNTYIVVFLLWARILNLPSTYQSLHLHSSFPTMCPYTQPTCYIPVSTLTQQFSYYGPYTQPTCYIPVPTLTQQFSYYGPVYSTDLLHTSLYTYIVVFLLWTRILNLPATYQSLHLHSSFPSMCPYTHPTCYLPVSTLTQQLSY